MGFGQSETMDMGALGAYQMFATGAAPVGCMMNRVDANIPPNWLYYFNVEAIDAALKRVKDKGGALTHGPTEVPGGSWIIQGRDPQGANFALVAPKR